MALPDLWQTYRQGALSDGPPNGVWVTKARSCILPATSSECERSIGVLSCLKTYYRSTMRRERMTGLALMHIKYGMDLNLDDIINIFAGHHQRRIAFCRHISRIIYAIVHAIFILIFLRPNCDLTSI